MAGGNDRGGIAMTLLFVLCFTALLTRSWTVGLGLVMLMYGLSRTVGPVGVYASILVVISFAGLARLRRMAQSGR